LLTWKEWRTWHQSQEHIIDHIHIFFLAYKVFYLQLYMARSHQSHLGTLLQHFPSKCFWYVKVFARLYKGWLSSICIIRSLWLECCWHASQPICYLCKRWSGFWIRGPAFFHQLSPSCIAVFWYRRPQRAAYNSTFIQKFHNV